MRARLVDWSLLALVVAEIVTGLWSFTVGKPTGEWLFWLHGILGLSLLPLLIFKFVRVARRVTEPRRWQPATLISVLTGLAVLGTVGIGVYWVLWQRPTDYPNGMILHVTAGFILLALIVWHTVLRYKPLRGRDLADRRSLLRLTGVFLGGTGIWGGVAAANRIGNLPGDERRFTGSKLADGQEDGYFPATMWMFDRPEPLDFDTYRLTIGGAVAQPMQLSLEEVLKWPQHSLRAALDCTGGWYTVQDWQGIWVDALLQAVEPTETASYVRFRALTGYRWSLPLAEARTVLLATHVGGNQLSHWYGAPLRLVAPGRRGFQWVKWVVGVDLLEQTDAGQWGVIFTSGLDRST